MSKPISVTRRRNERDPSNQIADTPAPTHDEIARRAYELFEERGREPGRELEDWLWAERELQARIFATGARS